MLFHSLTFCIFFALLLALYWSLGHRKQNWLLLLASASFYGWWDWRFLPLLGYSITVDYLIGRRLGAEKRPGVRKSLLLLSVGSNLGILFFFKYLGFFAGEFCELIGLFGEHHDVPLWIRSIILPIGISFFTFQTLSYVVDVYRGRATPVERWADYALFCSFFPQLLAGPIERSGNIIPQLLSPRPSLTQRDFSEGLYHVIIGLFKKVVVADNMAVLVNHIFGLPAEERTAWEALLGAYAFAFQIYGDFSGYSSMAQGIAKWMGINLSWNFKNPYFATSPQVFWQRWHITLSSWIRDYLFMPLMRVSWIKGAAKIYLVTIIVQLASGIWHGANWTFIAWGGLHGCYLCVQFWLSRHAWFVEPDSGASIWRRLPWILITFHLMCVGMILFRAESISQAAEIFEAFMMRWEGSKLAVYGMVQILVFVFPLIGYEAWVEKKNDQLALLGCSGIFRGTVYAVMLGMVWFLPPENTNEFIYFQF